jgi:L-histidine Nalpha-methyltransferase
MQTKFIKLGQENPCLNNLKIDAEDIIRGLNQEPKSLPSKYFYDDYGSEIFKKICELPEYYPTRTETSILRQCADEVVQITGICELVELGSGSSIKTQFLLDAYQKISNECKYSNPKSFVKFTRCRDAIYRVSTFRHFLQII